ncbi:MAG: TonB-dependent receptor [Chloracidobacterium sp.]|nr:TonB-dependent receptor [Chloracidobacterium sp.]
MRWSICLAATLAGQIAITSVLAQTEQATITGTVTDKSGAVIPDAKVVVTNIKTQTVRETKTTGDGNYTVPYLPVGEYEVAVEKTNFRKAQVKDVTLRVGFIATVDVSLEPGTVSEVLDVTSGAAQLESQNGSLGNVVGNTQLRELPLLNRNAFGLVTLAPGVIAAGNTGTGPIINGGRSNTSEVLLDGAELRNSSTMDLNYTPPLESIEEFKVITNSMSAEFGSSGGGYLTAVTKSGTNQLHGSFYEFLRNDKLNANSFTNNRNDVPRGVVRHNEYGGTLGGPVYIPGLYNGRDKTFFFVALEQVKDRSPQTVISTVPTALERAGDFSQTFADNARTQLIKIFDPATTRANADGSFVRDQFSCQGRINVICPDRIDPIALKILSYYPLPNRDTRTNNRVDAANRINDSWRLDLRIDHQIGTRHHLFVTYGRINGDQSSQGLTNIAYPREGVNGELATVQDRPRRAVISDTITFRPTLIGEFRASLSRSFRDVLSRSLGFDFMNELGIAPDIRPYVKSLIFPQINPSDVAGIGPDRASLQHDAESTYQFQGHFTWISGAHSVKSGLDYRFIAWNVLRPERPAGNFSFDRSFTQGPNPVTASTTAGDGVATLLLGAPTGGNFTYDPSLAASQKYYATYAQDDWKVARRLTLNLGLRWEYSTPWTDRFDQLSFFDPQAVEPVTRQKGVIRFVGADGNSRYQTKSDKNNFAPRLALAWEFMKDTVLRAGYGISYFPGSGGIGAAPSDVMIGGGLPITGVFLGDRPFPNTPPAGSSLADPFKSGIVVPPTTNLGESVTQAFPDWRIPFNHQWNLNIQRAITRDLLVEVAYTGNRGEHIWINRNRNVASASNLSLGNDLFTRVPNPFVGEIPGTLGQPTIEKRLLLRPFPQYGDITRFRDDVGDSIYHAFTLRADKRFAQSLLFQASYTISKNISNVPERFIGRGADFIDPNNLALSRSISENDRPQRLVINYVYELPFGQGKRWLGNGWAGRILGSWQVSGITVFQSGLPLVISGACSTNLQGIGCRPIRLKDPVLSGGQKSLDQWFDPTAFALAPAFSMGNNPRTEPNLRGPGTQNFDIGLYRNQRLKKESVNLQIGADFQNAFNTPQLNDPITSIGDPNFGKILGGGNQRQIQIKVRISY